METGDAMIADLISRARTGDANAFRPLTEPDHRELQVHCYRMLGSFQDSEDVLQETLLAAWHGLGRFEGRASLRTSYGPKKTIADSRGVSFIEVEAPAPRW